MRAGEAGGVAARPATPRPTGRGPAAALPRLLPPLLLALAAACGTASRVVPRAVPVFGRTPPTAALERESYELVNRWRTDDGLPLLAYDERIAAIAREHSLEMADGRRRFGHDGFDARVAAVRAVVPIRAAAENIALDSRTGPSLARRVVSGWIASPAHREAIDGAYDATGVGVAVGRNGVRYFTQIFVHRTP